MGNINWQFQATIPGGPVLILNQPAIPPGAYDRGFAHHKSRGQQRRGGYSTLCDTRRCGLPDRKLQLQHILTYTLDALPQAHALDGPYVLLGSGAVGFLDSTAPPHTLTFDNTLTKTSTWRW